MKIIHENGVIERDCNSRVEIIKNNDIVFVEVSDIKVSDILICRRTEFIFDEQPDEHVNNLAFFWLFGMIQSCGVVKGNRITLYFEEPRLVHIIKALCGIFNIEAFYETVDLPKDSRFIRTRTFKITNMVILNVNEILERIIGYSESWFEVVGKNGKNEHFAFLQGVYDATGDSAKHNSVIFSHSKNGVNLGRYQIMLERCGVFSSVIELKRRAYFSKQPVYVLVIGNSIDRDIYNTHQRVGFKRFIGCYSKYGNRYPYEFVKEYFGVTANIAYRKHGVPVGRVYWLKEYTMVPSKIFEII